MRRGWIGIGCLLAALAVGGAWWGSRPRIGAGGPPGRCETVDRGDVEIVVA
jgi:hypothetical protein